MSVTSSTGILSFGLQSGKEADPAVWHRHKALMAAIGPMTQKAVSDPEIGGTAQPTGSYKSGSNSGGRVRLQPRLEGVFGWILLGLMGHVVSADNDTTGRSHVFSHRPTADGGPLFIPWMGFRRHIPAEDLAQDIGDLALDCKIAAMTFNLPQVGPLSVDAQILGRIPRLDSAPDLWNYSDVYEGFESVPMVMTGGIRLPSYAPLQGGNMPATGGQIVINNTTTTLREERILGSYHPDDFQTRMRPVIVSFTYKWRDPDFYRFIFNGGDPAQNDFNPCIEETDFEMQLESPCPISAEIPYPWRIKFEAPRVDWSEDGPPQLVGDEIIMQQYTGTVLEAPSGQPEDYFQITLENTYQEYVLP